MTARTENMTQLIVDETLDDLIKNKLKEIVVKQLGTSKYKLWIENGSNKGDNFMGQIYRVFYCKDENDDSPTSLILKLAPKSSAQREKLHLHNFFLRETTMYDEVIAYFNEFQQSKGIIVNENGFNETPQCFHCIQDELSESLFLEDLKPRGFEMISLRDEPLTFDHVSLCLKAMGKLHAISFAIKDQQPQKFQELTKPIFEQYWTMVKNSLSELFESLLDSFMSILKSENRLDLYEKMERAVGPDHWAKVFQLTFGASTEPYAVLCHGDVTTNNVMFKKNEHGKPIEIQLFDWQFSRYASPVTDIVLFLLCSTSKELRDQHYDDFLKIYHESLSDLLQRLGSDPQKIFSYEVFLDQMQKYAVYTLFPGVVLIPILFTDIDSSPNMEQLSEEKNTEKIWRLSESSKQTYNNRIVSLCDDMVQLGYI